MKILVTQPSPQASTPLSLLLRKCKRLALLLFGMAFLVLPALAQNRILVKGRITDEKNQPVISASVVLKGTSTGTTTNGNGEFEINAPSNGTLVISSVGYPTKEIPIRGQAVHNFTLTTSSGDLEQVIVIGYGTQRKEAVTGSVASITGDRLREVPAPNITQALQGRIAGVEFSQTNTKPGSTMQIRVRGQRSLTASNDPLIVLDGIPFAGSIGEINPNDVKSIEILKDASATAIYGSRGANGVILITTNRGQKGKPRISYNGYYGMQTLFAKYPMMDGPEFARYRKLANKFTNGLDEADDVNTDWQDLFFNKTAMVTSQNIGVSGGTETGSYNFGGEYYKNESLTPTQQYSRFSFRGSVDQQVGKYFKLGFTTNNNYNVSEGSQVGLYGVISSSPLSNPYNADGSLKRTVKMAQDENFVLTNGVVKNLKDKWLNETRGYATYNSIYGEVRIPWVEGLKYRTNLGLDFIQNNNGNFTGMGVNSTNIISESTAGVSNSQTYHWTIENILTYDRSFAQKHNVNLLALYSSEQNKYNSSSMSARDIPEEDFQFYNLGAATGEISIGGGNYSLTGLESWMGRAMYSYDNRYMFSATFRTDGSSRLAPGHKWHNYPAFSVGWNISNESFMKGINFVDKLKLRAGYGQTSNQSVNPYKTLGVLGTRQYNFGDATYATGYYVTEVPNANLGWEYSETQNYALDFTLLKGRLSGTAEYYITDTKDLLMNLSLPATAGVPRTTKNVGQSQNKGFEFSLNGTILDDHNGWTWDAGFNIYTNKNTLVALASGQTEDIGNGWFVGHNIDAIYDFKKIGLWTDSKDSAAGYLKTLVPGGNVGMIKVLYTGTYDASGKPTRQIGTSPGADDRQIMDVDPDFEGGFNTRVMYKGFDLSAVGIFKHGGILISNLHGPNGYLNMLTGRRGQIKVDYWTPENTDAKYPKPGGMTSGDNPQYASTLAYFDASFMKIRTITLGYDLSRNLIKSPDIKMRMYFTVQNPFVMFSPYHKESGMDPETNSYGNENVATGGYQRRILTVGFNTPTTRNYIVGVNLTF
jgi:TonB-dependent starch-binding outer membrane protein SusC